MKTFTNSKYDIGDVVREAYTTSPLTITSVVSHENEDTTYRVAYKNGMHMEVYESEIVLVRRYNPTVTALETKKAQIAEQIDKLRAELTQVDTAIKVITELEGK